MKKISSQKLYEIIRNPLVSEKSTYVSQFNYYVFKVSNKSTKPQIKQAVEKLFDVKVISVNTSLQSLKKRRVGKYIGKKARYKRAIVTLAPENSIVLFEET